MQNPITTGDILAYNDETGQWENRPFEFLLEDYAPSLTIDTDNISIEIIEGVLQLKDFGVGYYAYVPAVKDEETGEVITPSTYEYVEGFKSGLEPRVIIDEDGNLCLAWYEPGTETVEDIAANIEDISKSLDNLSQVINAKNGLVDQIKSLQNQTNQVSTDLEDVKSNKADADSVYTKDEIDKSFENIYTKEEIINSFNNIYTKEETNIEIGKAVAAAGHLKRVIVENEDEIINNYFDKEDYDTYIFMVPTGLEVDADKYDEYIVINIDGMKAIEKVGSWEVDLADYAKKEEIGYVEGSRLITSDEITKLANLLEGAETNVINSVSSDFSISEDRQLNLNNLSVQKIVDLEKWLNDNASTVPGLSQHNLSDDLFQKLQSALLIKSINTEQLQIINSELSIKSIEINQVNTLEDALLNKANSSEVVKLSNRVNSLEGLLNTHITSTNSRLDMIEDSLTWKELTAEL